MGLFDSFKGPDFNEGIETYKNTKDAVLLDVRTQEEYLEGRVPGSWNIPLQEIQKVERLIDKAAPFEADRYYVVIYAAVVLAVAVVLARLAPQHETLLLLALVPILAAHRTDPNAYLYEDAAPRKAALADTERLPAVVLNKAGYEVAPDLFLEEFAKREAVDQASGEDDAASLRAAVESRDLHDGFLLYGYIYDADELRALAEDTLDVEKIELVTDGERCPVYYIELK